MNVTDTSFNRIYFQWYDHVLFGLMLILSTAIGIYFSIVGKKNTTDEYFKGNKKMFVFPIAMSLVASHVSSVTLLSVPADVYKFGAMYGLSVISIFFVCITASYVYLPVFYNLQLNSNYEYLKLRFNASIRSYCSVLYVVNCVLYMAIVVYVPSLAYTQATGTNIYYVIPFICSICTFYTTIGGLKAVVWTDTLQFSITAGAIFVVFILGLTRAGGISKVLDVAHQGDRLQLDFNLNLTTRETVFAVLMHWFLSYIRMTMMSQECVLKFLSLPTLRKAQQSVFLFGFGIIIIKLIVVVTGLILFTIYNGCDPVKAGLVAKNDQLVPFYVADMASGIPGLTGLFISGVFCTGLSTLSASLNALSATIYEDFVTKYYPNLNKTNQTGFVVKFLVVVMGVIIALLALMVEHLGPILPLAISVSGLSAGTFLGLFTLGMLCPRANSKGAFWGILSSSLIVGWMFIGAQWYKAQGYLKTQSKHLTTDGCLINVTTNASSEIYPSNESILYLYRISHYHYTLIGTLVCIVVGLCVSYATKREESDEQVPRELLSPIIHFMVDVDKKVLSQTRVNVNVASDEYQAIDVANKILVDNTSNSMEIKTFSSGNIDNDTKEHH